MNVNVFSVSATLSAILVFVACTVYSVRARTALSIALLLGSVGGLGGVAENWSAQLRAGTGVSALYGLAIVLLNLLFAVALLLVVFQWTRSAPVSSTPVGPA